MADTSLIYWQEKLAKTQARRLRISWSVISGAFTECVAGNPVLLTQGAIATQAVINTFLGTTAEFDYLAFDATSMGTDALGLLIDMKGQCAKVLAMHLNMYSSTYLGTAAGCHALGSVGITATTL